MSKIDYRTNNLGDVMTTAGVVVHLTQQAWADSDGTRVYYKASGEDDDGNSYLVTWDTTQDWDDAQAEAKSTNYADIPLLLEDESNACDWDQYTVIAL